ncbi:MAG: 2,3-bisphosphoglycerate-independent phosphoglycerate mutase [Desulfovibrionaceae bacterium]|nr:2,3-bisphosphoglycerate-independent phosphoglycerate mutase [Desulfovibrionaceae bacterium]
MTPTLLLILDGWGLAPDGPGNAPAVARTPNMDALFAACPHSRLAASGRAVGLPEGYIGNSEVGHLNIGAGRLVYQDMTRIDVAIEQGELARNPAFLELIRAVREKGGRLHLAGLLSDGGVHSHIRHLKELARIAAAGGVEVLVHCFMDGRDTAPQRGADYLRDLCAALASLPAARVATIIGRYYAMDRDSHWERVAEAWNLLVHGRGAAADDPVAAVEAAYAAGLTDEFITATRVTSSRIPDGRVRDGDGLFCFNFRADRMRQLARAFVLPGFDGFERGAVPHLAGMASMTAYDATLDIPVAFRKESLSDGLGETVSRAGLRQLRLAETEKYAHVTYFFNGGSETPFAGEDRLMVPSPRDVATYDLKPAMSAREVTDRFVEMWPDYDLVVCNLANGDMVGHTGNLAAAVQACEVVDECVGRMVTAVRARRGRMLLIADHGNCESMLDASGGPQTSHTTNFVPCILLDEGADVRLRDGKLADVAPTLLRLWGLDIPAAMTGEILAQEVSRG